METQRFGKAGEPHEVQAIREELQALLADGRLSDSMKKRLATEIFQVVFGNQEEGGEDV